VWDSTIQITFRSAPTRVRDCVAKQFFEVVLQLADASRRQSGPRKTTFGRRARCGLEVSPACSLIQMVKNQQRGLVVAIDAAKAPAGECGVENQVGRVGVF
jgi:hypothetical protein